MQAPGNSRSKNSADTLHGASSLYGAMSSESRTKQETHATVEQSLMQRGLSSQEPHMPIAFPLADTELLQTFDDPGTSRDVNNYNNGAQAFQLISGNFSTRSHTLSAAECEKYNADAGLLCPQRQAHSESGDAASVHSSNRWEENKIINYEGEYETYGESEEMEFGENASASLTRTSTSGYDPGLVLIDDMCSASDVLSGTMPLGSSNDCNANATEKEKKTSPVQRGRSPVRSIKGKVGRPRKMPGCDARGDIMKVSIKPVIEVEGDSESSPSPSRHCSPEPASPRRCSCSRSKEQRQTSGMSSRSRSSSGDNNSGGDNNSSVYGDSRTDSSSSRSRLASSQNKTGKRSKSRDCHDNKEADSQELLQANSLRPQSSGATIDIDSGLIRRESNAQNTAGEEEEQETREKKKHRKHSPHSDGSNHSSRERCKKKKKSSHSNCKCRHHSPDGFRLCLIM